MGVFRFIAGVFGGDFFIVICCLVYGMGMVFAIRYFCDGFTFDDPHLYPIAACFWPITVPFFFVAKLMGMV